MNNIIKAETISAEISKHTSKGASFLDALLTYCKETGTEIDVVASIIKRNEMLFQKAKEDAINHNLLSGVEEDENLDEFFK